MPVYDATNDYWLDDIRDTTPSATDAAQAAIERRAGRHEPSGVNRHAIQGVDDARRNLEQVLVNPSKPTVEEMGCARRAVIRQEADSQYRLAGDNVFHVSDRELDMLERGAFS